jgi:hypothetical protein
MLMLFIVFHCRAWNRLLIALFNTFMHCIIIINVFYAIYDLLSSNTISISYTLKAITHKRGVGQSRRETEDIWMGRG